MLPRTTSRRGGLNFNLFGFPVRVNPAFFFIVLLLGWVPGTTVGRMALWVVVVFVSILVHELGHALAARAVGAQSISIELHNLGGLTAYRPRRTLSRLEQVGVSLAGPFAGFALGALTLAADHVFGISTTRSGDNFLLFILLWVNFGWGLFNLLPVLPMDGGMVMQSLLPGNEVERARRGAVVSIVFASVAILVGFATHLYFLSIYFALLAAMNFALLNNKRQLTMSHDRSSAVGAALGRFEQGDYAALALLAQLAQEAPTSEQRSAVKTQVVESMLRQGKVTEARQALESFPGQAPSSLYALVDTVGGSLHGFTMLDEQLAVSPTPAVARHAVLARVLTGRAREVIPMFNALPPSSRDPAILREAQYLAHVRGDYLSAAQIGEQLLSMIPKGSDVWVMYNVACSWARTGDTERALGWLRAAVDAGWSDLRTLSTDQDLAALWSDPRFHELRGRLGAA